MAIRVGLFRRILYSIAILYCAVRNILLILVDGEMWNGDTIASLFAESANNADSASNMPVGLIVACSRVESVCSIPRHTSVLQCPDLSLNFNDY